MNVMATGSSVAPAAPTGGRPQAGAAEGGKDLPPAGKPAPASAPATDIASVEKAVEQINTYLRESKRQIEFQVDEASGRTVMRIVDAAGEVVRQVPSEEVLKIAATLDTRGFHSFNDLA